MKSRVGEDERSGDGPALWGFSGPVAVSGVGCGLGLELTGCQTVISAFPGFVMGAANLPGHAQDQAAGKRPGSRPRARPGPGRSRHAPSPIPHRRSPPRAAQTHGCVELSLLYPLDPLATPTSLLSPLLTGCFRFTKTPTPLPLESQTSRLKSRRRLILRIPNFFPNRAAPVVGPGGLGGL